jgi:hypothetical protein
MHHRAVRTLLSLVFVTGFASHVFASTTRTVVAQASGQIVSVVPCPLESETIFCQMAMVTGSATQLGAFDGVLFETVDITTGIYTGTATFTTTNGDTITTEYTGTVTPPNQQGRVFFVEDHDVVSGTGRFDGATGGLHVLGTADVTTTGKVQIVGVGTLTR